MHISLTDRLEAWVRAKVESGLYNNASEVIREALRAEIDKGLEDVRQGRVSDFDFDAIMAEIESEAAEKTETSEPTGRTEAVNG